ncbi:MAG: hypothetical protein KUG72_09210 [Pseudomonadales bacterium]|nr:hypothetical protein [Pseudomonadales bacterium]
MENLTQEQLTSFRLVRTELLRTLEQSKIHLESFTQDMESLGQLNAFVDLIEQVVGCLYMLKLQGVDTLTSEILLFSSHFQKIPLDQREQCLSVISCGLIELEQYFEYIDHNEAQFPALLLTTINKLRKNNSKQILPEHYFYHQNPDFLDAVSEKLNNSAEPAGESIPADRLRRLRQMYQIGLTDYIRESNTQSSLTMMKRALNRTIDQNVGANYSLIFTFAATALGAIQDSAIPQSIERKQLFAAIDKQFRSFIDTPELRPKTEISENLIRGFSYLFLVSGTVNEGIRSLVDEYKIKPLFFNESDIALERDKLIGPNAEANRSLMTELATELTQVKDSFELAFKTSELQHPIDFSTLIDPIKDISRIFEIAKMDDSQKIIQEVLTRVEKWHGEKGLLSEEEFSDVADKLTVIENQTHQLNSVNSTVRSNTPVQLGILQEAQQHVITETKDGLALTKRSIDAYLNSGGDSMNLANLATLMETVRGGTLFLGLGQVTKILKICQEFIQSNLIGSTEQAKPETLETLADVIISVEYYLENMDQNLNSNNKLLVLAEDGIRELAA